MSDQDKPESGWKRFCRKLCCWKKQTEKKEEVQEVEVKQAEEAPKPAEEPKPTIVVEEPPTKQVDSNNKSESAPVTELAPHSRPVSLFVQKAMDDTDDEALSITDSTATTASGSHDTDDLPERE